MQGSNRELACTQKNSTIIICFSMCIVLIVALLLGFRMKVKEHNCSSSLIYRFTHAPF